MNMTRRLATGFAAALAVGGFAAGAAFAGTTESGPAATTPTTMSAPMMMNGTGMMGAGTIGMADMSSMMGDVAMNAMHTSMHEAMAAFMPADVLAGCDRAHAQMMAAVDSSTKDTAPLDHASHHGAG